MARRIRALLLAEACNPEWVSVPLVGWSLVRALAEEVDAHLVTQIRNRDALLRAGWREGRDFTAIDTEAVARWIWRVGSWLRGGANKGWTTITALQALGNYHFESAVWHAFRGRLRRGAFDVVHRVTPVSPTAPSPFASDCRRLGIPFVLGPMNGGIAWPAGFERTRWQEGEWLSYLRSLYKLLPGYRATRRDAAALLIGSRATLEQMPAEYRHKCFYLPENAIDPGRFPRGAVRSPRTPLRAVFLGRLVPYKGADMLLEAAAPLLRSGALTLSILGEGPQKSALLDLRERLGVAQQVSIPGWIEHDAVRARLTDADVFTFPSVREFGGGVVLEAMASGLPPVVVDYGGPGELVTPHTGWTVPMCNRADLIERLRQVLTHICSHPHEVQQKSRNALRRAFEQFTWSVKAKQVTQVYDWVLKNGPKPMFAMPTPDVDDVQPLALSA